MGASDRRVFNSGRLLLVSVGCKVEQLPVDLNYYALMLLWHGQGMQR